MPGFGNVWLKCCAIEQFWGGHQNILSLIFETCQEYFFTTLCTYLEKRVLVLVYEPVDVVGDVPGVVKDDEVAAELESLWTYAVYLRFENLKCRVFRKYRIISCKLPCSWWRPSSCWSSTCSAPAASPWRREAACRWCCPR